MAAVQGLLDGPTVEEQVIAAEASSSMMELDLKQMREDRREFIKVAVAAGPLTIHSTWLEVRLCIQAAPERTPRPQLTFVRAYRQTGALWQKCPNSVKPSGRCRAQTCHLSSEPYWKTIEYDACFACTELCLRNSCLLALQHICVQRCLSKSCITAGHAVKA